MHIKHFYRTSYRMGMQYLRSHSVDYREALNIVIR